MTDIAKLLDSAAKYPNGTWVILPDIFVFPDLGGAGQGHLDFGRALRASAARVAIQPSAFNNVLMAEGKGMLRVRKIDDALLDSLDLMQVLGEIDGVVDGGFSRGSVEIPVQQVDEAVQRIEAALTEL